MFYLQPLCKMIPDSLTVGGGDVRKDSTDFFYFLSSFTTFPRKFNITKNGTISKAGDSHPFPRAYPLTGIFWGLILEPAGLSCGIQDLRQSRLRTLW